MEREYVKGQRPDGLQSNRRAVGPIFVVRIQPQPDGLGYVKTDRASPLKPNSAPLVAQQNKPAGSGIPQAYTLLTWFSSD